MNSVTKNNKVKSGLILGLAILGFGLTGCQQASPVKFKVGVPSPNAVQFDAELTKKYGVGLSLDVDLLIKGKDYGNVYIQPETSTKGLGFGFLLNGSVFMKQEWVDFREVSALPTGANFPEWLAVPMVEVNVDKANTPKVAWKFYFGIRSQYSVGVAAQFPGMSNEIPSVDLGYTFFDPQGRVVLGLLFFSPKKDGAGNELVPGGVLIASDLTPYLPADWRPSPNESIELNMGKAMAAVDAYENGRPVEINGQSVMTHIQVMGKDAHKVKSKKTLQKIMNQYVKVANESQR